MDNFNEQTFHVTYGATWRHGRLAAKTLHDALRASDLSPERCVYLNIFHDEPTDRQPCDSTLEAVRSLASSGATIIGLGRRVQAVLRRAGVTHLPLTHPAARGAIRTRATYQQHVRDTLGAAGLLAGGRPAGDRRRQPVNATERSPAP